MPTIIFSSSSDFCPAAFVALKFFDITRGFQHNVIVFRYARERVFCSIEEPIAVAVRASSCILVRYFFLKFEIVTIQLHNGDGSRSGRKFSHSSAAPHQVFRPMTISTKDVTAVLADAAFSRCSCGFKMGCMVYWDQSSLVIKIILRFGFAISRSTIVF